MTKGKWIVLILIFLLILFNGVRIYSSYQAKQEIKDDTMLYLKNAGYDETDIRNVDVVNIGGNNLEYGAVIIFEDEQDVDYLYTYKPASDQIIQLDVTNEGDEGELKHLE